MGLWISFIGPISAALVGGSGQDKIRCMLTDRRSFLMASGLTALAATRAWGANDTIRIGAIGCGGSMRSLLEAADQAGGCTLIAACDVYQPRTDEVRARTGDSTSTTGDYHQLLDRKDVDAVIIASPDHWHVQMASDAIAAGKDVYLEKPVTHTMEQGGCPYKSGARFQSHPAVRDAAEELGSLQERRRTHPGRQHRTCYTDPDVLVSELPGT